MKKILLSLFACLLLCSCGGNKITNKICGFIEEATERVEKATTLSEVEAINDKLSQNIAIYCLSLSEEEYKEWEKEPENNKIIQDAEYKYKVARQAREKTLKGQ